MQPLILYDIISNLPGNDWSPNPAKTRFILGYKKLPFETIYVEYADIAARLKEIGASPNILRDGSERYTVPTLNDPNTGVIVTDSWKIAEYLDETYPEKPVFPKGSRGLINAFDSALWPPMEPFLGFGFLRSSQIMNERSREYFIHSRPAPFGGRVDEWSPEGSKRDSQWVAIEKYHNTAKAWYEMEEGKWFMGTTFSYADILFAVRSFWLKRVLQGDEWKRIASLHEGKWERFLADVEEECNLA